MGWNIHIFIYWSVDIYVHSVHGEWTTETTIYLRMTSLSNMVSWKYFQTSLYVSFLWWSKMGYLLEIFFKKIPHSTHKQFWYRLIHPWLSSDCTNVLQIKFICTEERKKKKMKNPVKRNGKLIFPNK